MVGIEELTDKKLAKMPASQRVEEEPGNQAWATSERRAVRDLLDAAEEAEAAVAAAEAELEQKVAAITHARSPADVAQVRSGVSATSRSRVAVIGAGPGVTDGALSGAAPGW